MEEGWWPDCGLQKKTKRITNSALTEPGRSPELSDITQRSLWPRGGMMRSLRRFCELPPAKSLQSAAGKLCKL